MGARLDEPKYWNVADDGPEIEQAWDSLDSYIDAIIAERRDFLTEDLLSELIRAEDAGDRLSHSELLMLASGLLVAGTDTTRNQLAAAIHCLADHPDQLALLDSEPERSSAAVEELVRHYPVVFGTMRWATEDVELAGVTIPSGTLVLVNTAAANRDPLPRAATRRRGAVEKSHRRQRSRQSAGDRRGLSPPQVRWGYGMRPCSWARRESLA